MKNRISAEIIDSILRLLGPTGTTKMKIMYGAYLSYSQLNVYLSLLLEREFIGYERETKRYRITPAGSRFIRSLDEVRVMVGESEKGALEYPSLEETRSLLVSP
jgi:predicted transcriptional regulator